jgi:hypothetical protein
VYNPEGQPETVRYDSINAMLLNEFLKEHKKVEAQQATIAELKSTVAQQQKGMEILTAQLKEQLEMGKPATKWFSISRSPSPDDNLCMPGVTRPRPQLRWLGMPSLLGTQIGNFGVVREFF